MIHEKGDDFAPEAAGQGKALAVDVCDDVSDAIDQLWGSLFLSPERSAPKSIVVTSAESGEGATQIAAALALKGSSTEHGLRIALVDSNIHRPEISRVFGIPASPGFVDVIAGDAALASAVVSSENPRLSLLPAGRSENSSLSLLRSPAVGELIRELTQHHDHVIIDAPAVNKYAIAQALTGFTDGAVLVTKAGVTRREAVGEAKKRIELAQGRVLGVVLNQRHFPIPGFLYDRL